MERKALLAHPVGFSFFGKEYYPLMRIDGHVFLRTNSATVGAVSVCEEVKCEGPGRVLAFLLVRYSCLLSAGVLHAFSVSEGVFLMYPWREMCSASTYSSAILFSSHTVFFLIKNLVKHYFIESSQCGYT